MRLTSIVRHAYLRVVTRGRFVAPWDLIILNPSLIRIEGAGRIVLGHNVVIEKDARLVARDATLSIEAGVYVGAASTIVAFADVRIGEEVLLGERVSVHSEDHGPVGSRQVFYIAPVNIERRVWLCAGVVVTKGCTVGEGSTVGANAVVTSDIGRNVLAVGAPAHAIRSIPNTGER